MRMKPSVAPTVGGQSKFSAPVQLSIPFKLYGRDQELKVLSGAYSEISAGQGLVLLVPGLAGVGKTSLVETLRAPIKHQNGFFLAGKFNQFQRDLPLTAIRGALSQLGRELLAAKPVERAVWRANFLEATGQLSGLVTNLVPELELLLGVQPAVPDISPLEAIHRFGSVLRSFLGVVCQADHPVVLFLDDWQWADPASLAVLAHLQVNLTLRYLLVIVAYRANEVDSAHPLSGTIADLHRHAVPVRVLPVNDLTAPELQSLLADTLLPAVADLAGLTAFIHGVTRGNPFFVWVFLKDLHASRALNFDSPNELWRWNGTPPANGAGDNVVQLFARRLRDLPPPCQRLLGLASCLGYRFEMATLAALVEKSPAECLVLLRSALEEKLILPLVSESTGPPAEGADAPGLFIFQHDCVQQAAHALIAPDQLAATRLKIGRRLLLHLTPEQLAERVQEVADHLNAGCALLREEAEQVQLVALNVAAADRALFATAHRAALHFHRAARVPFAQAEFARMCWSRHHDLTREFFTAWAQSEFLEGDPAQAERCAREAVAQSRNPLEQASALLILIVQYTMLARYSEAIAAGRQALAGLGTILPDSDYEAARDVEIELVRQHRNGRSVDALCQAPLMTDPPTLMKVRVLIAMGPPCYRWQQRLWSVIVPKVVDLTLQYGPVPQVGYSHTAFAGLLIWVANDYVTAREFGELATRLMTEMFHQPTDRSIFHLMAGSSLRHWFAPMAAASQDYTQACDIGLRSGNLQYAAYAFGHNMYCRFFQGTPLPDLIDETRRSLEFSHTRLNHWAIDLLKGGLQVFGTLTGESSAVSRPAEGFEEDYLRSVAEHHNIQVACIYNILKTTALLVHGDHDHALRQSDAAESLLYTVGTQGLLLWPEHVFVRLMVLCALYGKVDVTRQTQWRSELGRILGRLRIWADHSPENFEPKYRLAMAELARIDGRPADAMHLYDQAVRSAQDGNFAQWEGMANERASGFWQERGNERFAHDYWLRAYVCYDCWGAAAKVRAMESAYRADLADHLAGGEGPGQPGQPGARDSGDAMLERQIAQLRRHASALRKAKSPPEAEIQTKELVQATERLRVEVVERRRAEDSLQEERERLTGIIKGANVGTWEWNVQTGETVFNSRWAEIIGYTLVEISPTSIETWLKFSHPDDLKVSDELLQRHFRGDFDYYECEIRMKHRDGHWVWVLDRGMVDTWTNNRRPVLMRGTHTDITERKQATEALKIAVKEKTAMLLEIHHRVKNNLQIVASLLNLQARTIQDPEATRALKDVESRISSMALLHEALYRSGNYSRVDFAGYAKELCAYLTGTYILTSGRVQLERQIGCFSLSMGQSVPCGMIINELVSNALKHAFPGDRAGLVLVELRETAEGLVLLRVSDNGTGLPEDFDLVRASTLGLRLIVNLARQLGGKCSFEKLATGGAAFQVVFPLEMTQPQSTK